MKNFFVRLASLLVMGAAVMVSCVRVQDVEDPTESLSTPMTLIASLDGTRTANDGNATVWVEGDLISALHCDAENPTSYRLEKFTNVNPNEFKGNVHSLSAVNNWYIMYPYSTDFESADAAPISIVDQVQNGNDNRAHMAGEAFPLYGRNFNVDKADAVTINMQNILAVFRASVTNKSAQPIIVKRVVVTTPKAVSGQFTGDLTQTPVVWTPGEQTSNSITLEVQNGTALAVNAETYFYVGLMPFTLEAGSELKIQVVAVHPNAPETEISYYITRSWADPVSWNSGRIQGVGINFDENHQTDPGDPSGPDDPQPEKTPRNLEFAETELVWTLGQGYETGSVYDLPTLSGVTEGVTYSSTNENVAVIVNGNKVRLVADGMTTIKASALATDTYEAGEASLSLQVLPKQTEPSTTTTYTKVSSLTVGGTYLIVDKNDARLFTAATDGSYVNINPTNGVISDPTNSYAGYEFTVTQSGSKLCLMHNNQYLIDDYSGNSTTGLVYESTKPADTYLYTCTVTNGAFFFTTKQRNGSDPNKDEYLYYKPSSMSGSDNNRFKLGGSGSTEGVHIYLKTSEGQSQQQQTQTISFAQPSVTWTLGNGYEVGGSYDMPTLTGAKTTVTYTSDNEGVARYSNGKIEIMGAGTAIITAEAVETAAWTAATATLTVTVRNADTPSTGVYERVTSELTSWDGTYLFVDETSGKAFAAFSDVTNYAVNVTINNGQIVASDAVNRYALTVTDAGRQHGNSNVSNQRAYNVQNSDGKYLYVSGGSIQIQDTNTRVDGSNTYTYNHAFKYFQNSGVQVLSANMTGSTVYYLGYESNAFSYAGGNPPSTANQARRVQLYKLNGDATPTPGPGPVDPIPGNATTYTKVTSLTVGATYIITDVDDARLFKGAADGSYISVNPTDGVIHDTENAYEGYEFTVTQSGSKYCILFNDGKYLVCDYSTSGNSTTGLRYDTAKPADNYLYALTVNNGVFFFSTDQMNSSSTNQFLYYKPAALGGTGPDTFKIGGSGSTIGVHLYQKTTQGSGKQFQDLYFAQPNVSWTLGSGYALNGTYPVQGVSGLQTTVTYVSSDESVAEITGNGTNSRIRIVGPGTATITAEASSNNEFFSSSASYQLTIIPSSGVMVYNLENDRVKAYLDYVEQNPYDPADYSYTYMTNDRFSGKSQSNRLDWPKPVPVSWTNPTSGNTTKTVYVYNDSAMTDLELSVPVTSTSSTSADVYNLIPGNMYYYKVVNGTNNQLTTGSFMTTGRRRMMKVGNVYHQNNANNCRDFGGQVGMNGRTLKYGKIYRGSNMDSIDSDARAVLTDYMKIGVDLDLRVQNEHRNPLNVTCPTPGYNDWSTGNQGLRNVSNMSTTLNAVFNAVRAGTPVYIHCAIGADRTGYVCMLLEAILGVEQGLCDVDYELTSFSVVGTKTRTGTGNYYYVAYGYGNNKEARGVDWIATFDGDTFQEKAINCLTTYYGIPMSTITAFQAAMLN